MDYINRLIQESHEQRRKIDVLEMNAKVLKFQLDSLTELLRDRYAEIAQLQIKLQMQRPADDID